AHLISIKEAENLYNILVQKRLIQKDKLDAKKNINLEYSFKKTILDKRWEIYIGKNDKNNDLLTLKFAHKFDLWFHAQGAAGSHIIIRLSNKNELPPAHIIEQAASIAAFHSDDKHSSTVAVIYTQVRFVRKPRKAKPGTVSVQQHKTIFVEPKNL
ncbi:NFACT RNA binding domain-containing protein, partial [Calditrichota bacterium]